MQVFVDEQDGITYKSAQNMDDVAEILRHCAASDDNVYDAETSGLDWQHNHIVGHVLTPVSRGVVPQTSYYIPVRHAGGGNVEGCAVPDTAEGWDGSLHPVERQLAIMGRERPRRWIGQNFGFDLRFLSRVGVDLSGVYEDTMINAPLIDENMRGFSLEKIALYNEVKPKDAGIYEYLAGEFGGKPERGQMSNWWRTNGSVKPVVIYAAGDGITTGQVWNVQQDDIDRDELGIVHGVECRLIRTLHRMTSRGINIDLEELGRVEEQWDKDRRRMMEALPAWFTNINAPTQLRKYFEDLLDENWPRNPPTQAAIKKAAREGYQVEGAPKFDEKTISVHERGRELVLIKKIQHAMDSFSTPLRTRHVWNGRVHAEFNQMKGDEYGTVTGRLSSNNPNLQQVPKRNKAISKPYRRVFLPEDGHAWWDNDYSQQEYVVFTNYTKDPNLVAGYSADPPLDIHTVVAEMMGVERDPTAKRMNLGILYGMGIDALAGHLGCSREQARDYQQRYHAQFPYAKQFLKQAEARAKNRGFVKTFLGRRRRFPDARFAHKAGNAVIQGSSADVTKAKMVEIDEFFESTGDIFSLHLQCHDSLSWSGPRDRADLNAEALRIMSSFGESDLISLGVPIRVDSGVGDNWSEATFGA